MPEQETQPVSESGSAGEIPEESVPEEDIPDVQTQKSPGGLPPVFLKKSELPDEHLVLIPQFPLTEREIVQAWRRLRQPVREGPPVELDIDKTIARRCRLGIISDLVLVPRRRNTARLLLLIDREGSMTPFHSFVENVSSAVRASGNLENVAIYYFHDVPVEGVNPAGLNIPGNRMFPDLDSVLPKIEPIKKGFLFEDKQMSSPVGLDEVLDEHAYGSAVVLISDAGAARGKYDIHRLLNTIAFLKGVRAYSKQLVWLNPLLDDYWKKNINTATHIARHVPMFSLDRDGIYKSINVLRGQPFSVERPL